MTEFSKAGAYLRKRIILHFAIASLFLPTLFPDPSAAAGISLSSQTYLLYYRRDASGSDQQTFAPVYEYFSGDARGLGGTPVSFHVSGWGRLDLGDESGEGRRTGDLASAYLQYLHPTGNGEIRLGRFFLAEGAAAEIIDGIFLKTATSAGVGVSAFGGAPVERSITAAKEGDSIYGGRLFFVRPGFAEIGVSYLKERGEFQGSDREVVGGDLWIRPLGPIELTGRAAYNLSTEAFATQRYVLRIWPRAGIDVGVGYEQYKYKDLFQTALNPAFLSPAIDNNDQVRSVFAILDWEIGKGVTLEATVKAIRHNLADPGDAKRGELGLRYTYNNRKDVAGLAAAVISADRAENEYQEYRAFASYSPGKARFAMDVLTDLYKREIDGKKNALQVVGTAGYEVLPYLKLLGDLRYTKSPRFEEDYAALVRAVLAFNFAAGGSR